MSKTIGLIRKAFSALVPVSAAATVGYLLLTRGSSLLAALAAVRRGRWPRRPCSRW